MANYHSLGTVSSGTMLATDLLESFAWELANMPGKLSESEVKLIDEAIDTDFEDESTDPQAADDLVHELFDALGEYAPPYCYFGAHEGDGADYGFWPVDLEQAVCDGDLLKVNDLARIPEDYRGDVMLISDHGNITIGGICNHGQFHEYWAIV